MGGSDPRCPNLGVKDRSEDAEEASAQFLSPRREPSLGRDVGRASGLGVDLDGRVTERRDVVRAGCHVEDADVSRQFVRVEQQRRIDEGEQLPGCLLYTSPSPRDGLLSRMPSSA